jgi:C1A family cysteine protease
MTEASYPYKAVDGTCQYNVNENAGVETTGYQTCEPADVDCMKANLALKPIACSVYVNDAFHAYSGGIFNDTTCPEDLHNHATNLVGWGVDANSGVEYWIMRNSWGTDWGEQGYMYVQINQTGGICGIQNYIKWPDMA